MSRDWDKETGESQETHSFSYQSKHRVKGIRKGDFTSRAQNVTGEGRGREGRWWADLVCRSSQLACMMSLVRTVQYWALLMRAGWEGYIDWAQVGV